MLILGDVAGPAYLPVFLQLVMCCTAGSIDSGLYIESKEVKDCH